MTGVRIVKVWRLGRWQHQVWITDGQVSELVGDDLGYFAALDLAVRLKVKRGCSALRVRYVVDRKSRAGEPAAQGVCQG